MKYGTHQYDGQPCNLTQHLNISELLFVLIIIQQANMEPPALVGVKCLRRDPRIPPPNSSNCTDYYTPGGEFVPVKLAEAAAALSTHSAPRQLTINLLSNVVPQMEKFNKSKHIESYHNCYACIGFQRNLYLYFLSYPHPSTCTCTCTCTVYMYMHNIVVLRLHSIAICEHDMNIVLL